LEEEFSLDARVTPVEVLDKSALSPFAQAREQHDSKRSVLILLGKSYFCMSKK
jgi:hypothetical protein